MANRQLDALSRRERLRFVRDCCFWLGMTLCLLALIWLGSRGAFMANPKAWATTGGFTGIAVHLLPGEQQLALALFVSGILLLAVALALTIYLRSRR
jgi:hypothetical protein